MERFWKHSMACGILARALARRAKADAERCFVAGLLHDIGRMALFCAHPDTARRILDHQAASGMPMVRAEHEVLGFDHARLGAMLLRRWNFPFPLATAVLRHHEPSADAKHLEPCLIHLADQIAKAMGLGASLEFYVGPLDADAWERAGLRPQEVRPLVEELEPQFSETFRILLSAS
jgi:putative nucleotidyltransferase with HDIG domain